MGVFLNCLLFVCVKFLWFFSTKLIISHHNEYVQVQYHWSVRVNLVLNVRRCLTTGVSWPSRRALSRPCRRLIRRAALCSCTSTRCGRARAHWRRVRWWATGWRARHRCVSWRSCRTRTCSASGTRRASWVCWCPALATRTSTPSNATRCRRRSSGARRRWRCCSRRYACYLFSTLHSLIALSLLLFFIHLFSYTYRVNHLFSGVCFLYFSTVLTTVY